MQRQDPAQNGPEIVQTLTLRIDLISTLSTKQLIKIHLTLSKNMAPGKIDTVFENTQLNSKNCQHILSKT